MVRALARARQSDRTGEMMWLPGLLWWVFNDGRVLWLVELSDTVPLPASDSGVVVSSSYTGDLVLLTARC